MDNPDFEVWQLKVLLDSVYSARFLTDTDVKNFEESLYKQAGTGGKKKLKAITHTVFEKSENPSVKNNIDALITAVYKHKKIVFQYEFTDIKKEKKLKRNGHKYTVSPYSLYRRDDRYYIIVNTDGFDDLSCYRLDRIKHLEVTDRPARPAESIVGSNADKAIEEYIKNTLYNFGGKKITLTLEIKENAIDDVIEFFGRKAVKHIPDPERNLAAVRTTESEGLYRWLLQYVKNVTALSPDSVTEEIKKRIIEAANSYNISF